MTMFVRTSTCNIFQYQVIQQRKSHQTSSNGFRRHPTASDAIQRHQTPSNGIRRHPTASDAIQRLQTPSNGIRRHPTASHAIQRHPTPFQTTQWHLMFQGQATQRHHSANQLSSCMHGRQCMLSKCKDVIMRSKHAVARCNKASAQSSV